MGTTAQKLQAVANSKAAIKAAIQAKGVSDVGDVLSAYASKIQQIPSGGGGEVERKEVNFIDYDGTVLHSYTKQEALALTELPALPSRTEEGLTCQEWNYTLAQMKSNVNSSGKCDVGATYITTDGKTHIYITIPDDKNNYVIIRYYQSQAGGVVVDWGDGSTPGISTRTGNTYVTHTYSPASYPHQYVIKVGATVGTMAWNNGNIRCSSTTESATNPVTALCGIIDKLYIGNATAIGNNAFSYCRGLTSVTIPNSVTGIGDYAFQNCTRLTSVTIPNSVSSFGNRVFQNCSSLASVTIPSNMRISGNFVFSQCYGLTNVTLGSLSYTGLMSIQDSMFSDCYSLANVNIPDSTTSIGNSAFSNCKRLTSVTIPANVTNIGSFAFLNCYGLQKVDCTRCQQIPYLGGDAFNSTFIGKNIIVPNNLYYDWIEASNWRDYAYYIKMQYPSLTFRATESNSTITLEQVGEPEVPASLEYMQGSGGWQTYTVGDTITLANVGDAVFFRATPGYTNNFGSSQQDFHQFTMSGGIEALGSINYLTNSLGNDYCDAYCFCHLFDQCSALVHAPDLPSSAVGESCFDSMFQECTGLTEIPQLPGNDAPAYSHMSMFKNCTGITYVDFPWFDLNAMGQGCFDSMFNGCSNLSEINCGYDGYFSNNYFSGWVGGVADEGTFYYSGGDTTRGDSAIPENWTVS